MGDTVAAILEEMIPELEHLKFFKIFTKVCPKSTIWHSLSILFTYNEGGSP